LRTDFPLITSRANPFITETASLIQRKKREELGLFMIEGEKLVKEAGEAGLPVENFDPAELLTPVSGEADGQNRVSLIVYTGAVKDGTMGDYIALHRRALALGIPCFTSLDTARALAAAESLGLRPKELLRKVNRKHIFTHIRWDMTGIYMEVAEPVGPFQWFTAEQIHNQAALPTAFRQFWEEI